MKEPFTPAITIALVYFLHKRGYNLTYKQVQESTLDELRAMWKESTDAAT